MSKHLALMESRLGVPLVVRTTRRMSLTPEGELYLESARRILGEIDGMEELLGVTRATPKGLLRVNATLGFGRGYVAPLISRFVRKHPQVAVLQLVRAEDVVFKSRLERRDTRVHILRGHLFHANFQHKIGDTFVYDGERYLGRICPGFSAALVPRMMDFFAAGPRLVPSPQYYYAFWYAPVSRRDETKKKYDGIGFRNVLHTEVEPPPKLGWIERECRSLRG